MFKRKRNFVHCGKELIAVFLAVILVMFLSTNIVSAGAGQEAKVRLIFTTDIHGQLNSKDYELGTNYVGGLSRAYTLIKKARLEVEKDNSFLFDIGDVIYDATTEFILTEDPDAVQPIYEAMSQLGYDAITLGNHDFDYGYDYIMNQMSKSGLLNSCIVSNAWNSRTKEFPFNENKIITRKVKTTDGSTAIIKVGVIGETIPKLSTKTESYTGILETEDIVTNVKKQSAKLKAEGADIVVVLAHSGFGPEQPEEGAKNVSYALTKIPEVDVVLCGHEHKTFPTNDMTSNYYNLPGVDKNTKLVNGKTLTMANDRGRSIGVVDLSLDITTDGVVILDQKSEVREVTNSTKEEASIGNLYGEWEGRLSDYSNKEIATIDSSNPLTNYFGLIEDNNSMQLINNAKIAYGLRYVNNKGIAYKDRPVIAVSAYNRTGQNSISDYVDLSGTITEAELSSIQMYNGYVALYDVTGKQVREWLEWTASAYQTLKETPLLNDDMLSKLIQEQQVLPLVSADWLEDWTGFVTFDGIEYVIDPSVAPRYDKNGNKINDTSRIKRLTYNGVAVPDTARFVLVSNIITKTSGATKGLDQQAIYKGYNRMQAVLSSYVQQLNKTGDIKVTADHNWKLDLGSKEQQFIVEASKVGDKYAKNQNWYVKTFNNVNAKAYYLGSFTNYLFDKTPPNVVLTTTMTEKTNNMISVAVNATDMSGILSLTYLKGTYEDVFDAEWNSAAMVKDGLFQVDKKGIYSVLAVDNQNNRAIYQVDVDNIDKEILEAPIVNTYTNRKTKITGRAQPGSTVYFEAATGNYETIVKYDGTFSYPLPSQSSGTKVTVYAKDEYGRESDKKIVKVKRTGPNQPIIDTIGNNSRYITGNTNDNDADILAIITDEQSGSITVYGSEEAIDRYKQSAIYNKAYNSKVVPVTISGMKYSIQTEPQSVKSKVVVYGIDHLKRASRPNSVKVKETGPGGPIVYDVTQVEKMIYGYVDNIDTKKNYRAFAQVGGMTYTGEVDKEGNFCVELGKLAVNGQIQVYISDYENGVERKGATTIVTVQDISQYYNSVEKELHLNQATNKDSSISGYYNPNEPLFIVVDGKTYEVVTDVDGNFNLELDFYLTKNTNVYVYARYAQGDMIEADGVVVMETKPNQPSLYGEQITNTETSISVISEEQCEIIVQVDSKVYKSTNSLYQESWAAYLYKIEVGAMRAGQTVTILARNGAGDSKKLSFTVKKEMPEQFEVSKVTDTMKKVTGYVELVEVTMEGETLTTYKSTETTVYAEIKDKIYEGKVNEKGIFEIKIPKQKVGTKISAWVQTINGVGPKIKITVEKAEKKS